jgi:hypothetical protein
MAVLWDRPWRPLRDHHGEQTHSIGVKIRIEVRLLEGSRFPRELGL